jgi:hypothetical protein
MVRKETLFFGELELPFAHSNAPLNVVGQFIARCSASGARVLS